MDLVGSGDANGTTGGDAFEADELFGRPTFAERGRAYKIIVVGDWGIEDRWVLGPETLGSGPFGGATASALHNRRDAVQSLFGAGEVALLLHGAASAPTPGAEPEPLCEILGIGMWSRDDTKIVKAFFSADYALAKTPVRVQRMDPPPHHQSIPRIRLFDLARSLPADPVAGIEAHGTSRVFQLFESRGGKVEPRERIEWEVPAPRLDTGAPSWTQPGFDWAMLEDALEGEQSSAQIDAVVVVDLGRGSVTPEMLRFLKRKCLFAEWFVTSQSHAPAWLRELRDVELRLLALPPNAARAAESELRSGRWMTGRGCPSRDAVDALGALREQFNASSSLSIAVSSGSDAWVGIDRPHAAAQRADALVAASGGEPGWSAWSRFGVAASFASLTANYLRHPQAELAQLLPVAQSDAKNAATYAHGVAERRASPLARPKLSFLGEGSRAGPALEIAEEEWEQAVQAWRQAARDDGVISVDKERPVFELWRSMQELDGYVACERRRKRAAATLARALSSFASRAPRATVSALVTGAGGSGRSTLGEKLAESFDFELLRFDLAQLGGRADVTDVFDEVASSQARRRARPLLVTIDAVDTAVAGDALYETFLGPLESGHYSRGGRVFRLEPSVWLFSGTGHLSFSTDAARWRAFVSRMTLGEFQLAGALDPADRSLENVYLGVHLIRKAHSEVQHIERRLLELFRHLPQDVSTRELSGFVGLLDVRDERVGTANVPRGASIGKLEVDDLIAALISSSSDEWVEIVA